MNATNPGLETHSSAASGLHMSGASLRLLGECPNQHPCAPAEKIVNRKAQNVHRITTSTSDLTRFSDLGPDDAPSKASSIAEQDHNVHIDVANAELHKKSVASNLVIVDYDDTLLPTFSLACSHRRSFGNQLADLEVMRTELDQLNQAILVNLTQIIKVARLVIVTNASSEWLTQSCERYLPRVCAFFAEHNIRIISARDRFENSLLAQKHWKYFIFIDLVEELFMEQLKRGEPFAVCSIGDGAEEREACLKLSTIFKNPNWAFKNLKLLAQPTIGYLIQQHVLLSRSFNSFFEMKTSADLCILFDKKTPES